MAECLTKAGIPAKTQSWDDAKGQKQLELETDEPYTMSLADGGGITSAGNDPNITDADWEATSDRLEELAAKHQPPQAELDSYWAAWEEAEKNGEDPESIPSPKYQSYLIIGETDHTEAFSKCLKDSGYTEPVWENDPAEELKQKERTLEATNEWIKCARDNGYPNLEDPAPAKADDWETSPMAILPGDITEGDLRTLLGNCPNFDRATAEKMIDELIKLGPDASEEEQMELAEKYGDWVSPEIGFDLPGANGQPYSFESGDEGESEAEDPAYTKGQTLSAILWEEQNAFGEEMSKRLQDAGFEGW
jgi:hypothetical protein